MNINSTLTNYPVTEIQADEHEEELNSDIGAGSYGQCKLKKFLRLGIQVVEKQLHQAELSHIYQEAYYMQLFSHRCIPPLLGVQVKSRPFSIIMEFLGYGNDSDCIQAPL